MASGQLNKVVEYLRRGALLSDGGGLSDGQLLECYLKHREEAAFRGLMRRHGSMVWEVCRRIIGNHHDAEDAFQATFLVLFRKAAAVEPRAMVANWLYGVAYHTALKARAAAVKRRTRERQVAAMPVVLCDLEGKTHKEAARRLGCPEGTLSARLSRARSMLARRLARHGLALSAGSLAAVLAQNAASACAPAVVVAGTIKAIALVAAGQTAAAAVSANAAVLAEGVVKTMLLSKLKCVTAVLVAVSGLAVGAGVLGHALATEQGNGTSPAKARLGKVEPAFDGAQVVSPKMPDVQRSDASWKLRQIGLAFQQYNEQMKSLPAQAIYSKDGTAPLLSWRVAILPYLGQNALYRKFKLDEPWDSPHNKQLIAKMPSIYEPAASGKGEEGLTYWQVFTGANTVFDGKKKMALGDIKDGAPNTILVIEGKDPVIWTKPADLTLPNVEAYRQLCANYSEVIHRRAQREAAAVQVDARTKEHLAGKATVDFLLTALQQWAAALSLEYTAITKYNFYLAVLQFRRAEIKTLPGETPKAYIEMLVRQFEIAKKDIENRIIAAMSDFADWKDRAAWSARMAEKGLMSQPEAEADARRMDAAHIALSKLEEEKGELVARNANDLTLKLAQAKRTMLAQAIVGLEKCRGFVETKMDIERRIEVAKAKTKLEEGRAARFSKLAAQGAMSKELVDDAVRGREAAQVALAYLEEENRRLAFTVKQRLTDLTTQLADAERIAKLAEMSEAPFAVGGSFKNGILALFCDGSVRFLPRDIDPTVLRAMITPNGGEVIDKGKLKK